MNTFEVRDYASLRRSVEEWCAYLSAQEIPADAIFDCKLVAFELLANALKHGDGGATFQGALENGFVQLRIKTQTPFFTQRIQCSDAYAESGRGLFLVENVCAERLLEADGSLIIRIKIKK